MTTEELLAVAVPLQFPRPGMEELRLTTIFDMARDPHTAQERRARTFIFECMRFTLNDLVGP